MARKREACGRCSTSVVVETTQTEQNEAERTDRDPYGEARIEVDEDQLRTVSPDGWVSRVSARLDELVRRVTWGT